MEVLDTWQYYEKSSLLKIEDEGGYKQANE